MTITVFDISIFVHVYNCTKYNKNRNASSVVDERSPAEGGESTYRHLEGSKCRVKSVCLL